MGALSRAPIDALIGRLGVGELLTAAAIAAIVDQFLRRVEIGARRGPGVGGGPARHEAAGNGDTCIFAGAKIRQICQRDRN
jgi:hypothetical protein